MQLTNEFRVGVPVEQAWTILTDIERIAPCLPGAQLQEIEGDRYRGVVKVKVGPITAQYKGTATFVEQDVTARRVVLKAEGRDVRGQGNANATVTATLVADGGGTAVKVVTDLTITGKVAQFGRGVLGDVSGKLIGQFVANLERDVLSGVGGGAGDSAAAHGVVEKAVADNGVADEAAAEASVADEAVAASVADEPGAGSVPEAVDSPAPGPAAPGDGGDRGAESTPTPPGARSAAWEGLAPMLPDDAVPSPAPANAAAREGAGRSAPRSTKIPAVADGAATGRTPATAAANGAGSITGVRRIDSPEVEPVDLLATAGSPVAKRLIPVVGAVVSLAVLWRLLARHRRN